MKTCFYKNDHQDLYLIDENNDKIIVPFIKNYDSKEICCLDSIFLYLGLGSEENINFKISSEDRVFDFYQLFCINSFKKRKLISKKIKLDTDPEDFKINTKDIPELICLFNFFKKTNLINCNQYFFGFLINYYFSAIEKR